MKLTTEAIIKMLPFEEEFKNKLLANWDSLSDDQKFNITETLWDTYAGIYQIRYETNLEDAMNRVQEGTEKMDDGFGKRIREQTEKEMQEQFSKTVPQADLVDTREELQNILNDSSNNNN